MSRPSTSYQILVIGAGLGGLAAATRLAYKGHKVRVLEGKPTLSEVGAGVQVPPNATRILSAWGLASDFEKVITDTKTTEFRRYESGEVLGVTHTNSLSVYGSSQGHKVRFDSQVISINSSGPSVTLDDNSVRTANLVVGADGIRSIVRAAIFPNDDVQPRPIGECVYQAMLPREVMLGDPDISHLMKDETSCIWMGPRRYVVGYPIRRSKLNKMVISCPGKAPVGIWNAPGDVEEMRTLISDFDPVIRKLLGHVQSCQKWTIAELPSLPSWTSQNGRVVLLGDAAHAMVPHLAQGATQCIEDAAVLGECISKPSSGVDISLLTKAYQDSRKARVERVQAAAMANVTAFSLTDGPEQERRDEKLRASRTMARNSEPAIDLPEADMKAKTSEMAFQVWLYRYDAIEEAKRCLQSHL